MPSELPSSSPWPLSLEHSVDCWLTGLVCSLSVSVDVRFHEERWQISSRMAMDLHFG